MLERRGTMAIVFINDARLISCNPVIGSFWAESMRGRMGNKRDRLIVLSRDRCSGMIVVRIAGSSSTSTFVSADSREMKDPTRDDVISAAVDVPDGVAQTWYFTRVERY